MRGDGDVRWNVRGAPAGGGIVAPCSKSDESQGSRRSNNGDVGGSDGTLHGVKCVGGGRRPLRRFCHMESLTDFC
jgi:hypothetical protein